jgi:hypothetical protein
VLKSTAHIPSSSNFSVAHGWRRSEALSYLQRCYGSFSLHLCPEHPDAFDDHQPRTEGRGSGKNVTVSCSCGSNLGLAAADTFVSRYPAKGTEYAWFEHLPAELRWYLWRGARQWAVRELAYGRETVRQCPTEQRARDLAAGSGGKQVVYRDAEGEPWQQEQVEQRA